MSCLVPFFAAEIRESVVLRSVQTYILNFCDLPRVLTFSYQFWESVFKECEMYFYQCFFPQPQGCCLHC